MEGWKENIIADFGEVITGCTPSTKNSSFWENGDYPFYSPADFSDKMFCDITEKHITKAGLMTGRIIYPNSVMVTCIASIGKMAINSKLGITNQQINTIAVSCDFDYKFIYYLLSFNTGKIKQIAPQTTVPILNKTNFSNLKFYLPTSISEQQKISNILNTIDVSIAQTEQLIAKYKNVMKGLMHDLLNYGIDENGTIRNPETHTFEEKKGMLVSEEWDVVELNEIATIGNGCDYKHLKEGNIPVFGTGGYMTSVNDFLYDGETVCIGRKGTIDLPQYHTGKIWTVDTLFYTHSFSNILPKFLFFIFQTINWKKYNEATGVPSLSKKTISKIKISIPAKIDEQHKIISIIEQQDNIIGSEQTNLTKLQKLKQGLMADLLTGKIRVNTDILIKD